MSRYSPRPSRESMGKDYVCSPSPGCPNCKDLFEIFSETEAKRFNAVEVHLPFWRELVKEGLSAEGGEARLAWLDRAQRALKAYEA